MAGRPVEQLSPEQFIARARQHRSGPRPRCRLRTAAAPQRTGSPPAVHAQPVIAGKGVSGAHLDRLSAVITIVGSALFLGAALLPVSRVFVEPSPVRKLEIITASPNVWTAAQIFFGIGAVLTIGGLALAAIQYRGETVTWLAYASVALVFIGAVAWTGHLYARVVDPATFSEGALPAWPLFAYFVLTPTGLAGFGVALLRSPLPQWVGWLLIGSMMLVLIATAGFRDIPPGVYYVPTLVTGVMLYRFAF